MTNETDDHADAAPNAGGGDQSSTLLQVEDQLFRHQMTLKHLDFQVMTPKERLTIMVLNTVSLAFGLFVVGIGVGVAVGLFSLTEAVHLVQDLFITLGIVGALIIALLSAIAGSFDIVETVKRLREGPPEPVYDIEELEAETTESRPQESVSESE